MSSASSADRVRGTIRSFLKRQSSSGADVDVDAETQLFGEGLGLDSLQTAELSVMLEDEIGRDPFSEGELPQTVGEIIDFYESK
jgi:acyl carrier protein